MTEKKRVRLSELQQQRRTTPGLGCSRCGCTVWNTIEVHPCNRGAVYVKQCHNCGFVFKTTERMRTLTKREV